VGRKFIRGTIEIESNVTSIVEFETRHEPVLKVILDWGDYNGISLQFGTSLDNTYLCEFDIRADTAKMCKGYLMFLVEKLKAINKKARVIFQAEGNVLW
jgi:hypothetical protein